MKFMYLFSLVFLSLTISGCGGNGNSDDISAECSYYNKLKEGQAGNIAAKGNQANCNTMLSSAASIKHAETRRYRTLEKRITVRRRGL